MTECKYCYGTGRIKFDKDGKHFNNICQKCNGAGTVPVNAKPSKKAKAAMDKYGVSDVFGIWDGAKSENIDMHSCSTVGLPHYNEDAEEAIVTNRADEDIVEQIANDQEIEDEMKEEKKAYMAMSFSDILLCVSTAAIVTLAVVVVVLVI